jgi:hypothetical protein
MTIRKYLPLLCCLVVFVLSAEMFCADDAHTDAKQLLDAAHQASGLSTPYVLQGTVVINPGTPNEKKGSITIYRDHDRSRSDLQVESYHEIKLVRDNKLYIYRSTPLPVPLLGKLAETDHSWDKLADDGDAKLGDVSKKKVQNQQANCFDVKGGQRHRLCFDPEKKVLLESMDQQRAIEFTSYSEIEGHLFPAKITVLLELERQEKPVLVIEDIEIHKADFAATAFAIPAQAIEFDTCDNMQPAKPMQTPAPEFSNGAMRRNAAAPVINVYGIVGKDGKLENIKMLTTDAEVQQAILEAMKKWQYTPARCGNTPVASEKEIPLSLFGGAVGEDAGSGRRGR